MKKFIIILFFTFPCFSYATWDIEMRNFSSDNVSIKMELVSVPFEGLNRYNMGQSPYNRIGIIQFGCFHRRFLQSPTVFADSQIVNYESFYRVASTFSEIMHLYPMYGFGKYLITITNNTNSSRSIKFYWNTLDSKIGSDSVRIQGDTLRNYRCDWAMS